MVPWNQSRPIYERSLQSHPGVVTELRVTTRVALAGLGCSATREVPWRTTTQNIPVCRYPRTRLGVWGTTSASLALPQRAVVALRSHRKRQTEEKLRATDYKDSGVVVATGKGTPLDAQNIVNRHVKPLLKRAGLWDIR